MRKIITGFTPTGDITIANYLGVIKPLLALQDDNELFIFCANLHAITELTDKSMSLVSGRLLKKKCYEMIAILLACGFDSSKNHIFIQSINPNHQLLFYYLLCFAKLGELERMNQFKMKQKQKTKNTSIGVGLLLYPCLMAADILLYNCDIAFVGSDQKQHFEFCQSLIKAWRQQYKTFEPFTPVKLLMNIQSAKICALDNPKLKMSKSSLQANSYISMFDKPSDVEKKILLAITDSENSVHFDKINKPGVSNLMTIYSEFSSIALHSIEQKYVNKTYRYFKLDLIEIINSFLVDFQKKYHTIYNKKAMLDELLLCEKSKLQKISNPLVKRVSEVLGIV